MGAFTSVTHIATLNDGTGSRRILISAVCPATYDANGSTIDVSEATLGSGHGLAICWSIKLAGRAIAGATAGAGYDVCYVPAAAYDAATGKLIVSYIWQATPAEASGDLSTTPGTLMLVAEGR